MSVAVVALLGTIMMSGSGILTNGKGTRREYGEFNLDELQVCVSVLSESSDKCHVFTTHESGCDNVLGCICLSVRLSLCVCLSC